MTEGRTGVLRLVTATSAYGVLGSLLRTAGEHLPHIEIVLRELVTRDRLERLAGGDLDVGLVRPPVPPGLETRPLGSEPPLAALPADHPLCAGDELDLADFHGTHVIGYSPFEARYFHDLVVSVVREAGVRPAYVQHAHRVHTVLALVEVGLGVVLVPATASRLRLQGVTLPPVRLPDPEPVELHLTWRAANDNPVLHAFLDLLP